jgi:hypothetical protein
MTQCKNFFQLERVGIYILEYNPVTPVGGNAALYLTPLFVVIHCIFTFPLPLPLTMSWSRLHTIIKYTGHYGTGLGAAGIRCYYSQ